MDQKIKNLESRTSGLVPLFVIAFILNVAVVALLFLGDATSSSPSILGQECHIGDVSSLSLLWNSPGSKGTNREENEHRSSMSFLKQGGVGNLDGCLPRRFRDCFSNIIYHFDPLIAD